MQKTKRKRALYIIAIVLAAILLIHVVSMLGPDRSVQYVGQIFTSPKINEQSDGYTVAFVTDTHALTAAEAAEITARINQRGADVLLLGGDYAPSDNDALMAAFAAVDAPDGVYGVEGNHDNYAKVFAAMRKNGVTPLDNTGVRLRDGLYLGGTADLWNRTPDIGQAFQGAAASDCKLLLAHNPDTAMLESAATADLILSGHTHGGQATFFGLYAPLLDSVTAYGYRSGWYEGTGGVPLYVSNGAGRLRHWPRIFARPQVIFITLKFA